MKLIGCLVLFLFISFNSAASDFTDEEIKTFVREGICKVREIIDNEMSDSQNGQSRGLILRFLLISMNNQKIAMIEFLIKMSKEHGVINDQFDNFYTPLTG